MAHIETPDDIDDRLRELFHSFDSTSLQSASAPIRRRVRLSRGRAIAWAGVIAVALVVALVSLDVARSGSVKTPTGPSPAKAYTSAACSKSQLEADVVFNQPGTELGAIRITDTSNLSCSLSGRPQIVVYDAAGHSLDLSESADQRAPDLPAPKTPVELPASGSAPQAVVELDWCGFQTLHGEIGIRFSGWTGALVVPGSSIMPTGFSPPACLDPAQRLLAVDYVRAWQSIAGVPPVPPSVKVTVLPSVVHRTPACNFDQLAVTATFGGAALGHESVLLLFKDASSTTCSLYGYPGVAGLNVQGVQITQAVRTLNGYMGGAGKSAPHVTLTPGLVASAVVEGTDVPTGNATTCPTYASLLVTPPNTTQSVPIHFSLPGCSGLQVHPIIPRT